MQVATKMDSFLSYSLRLRLESDEPLERGVQHPPSVQRAYKLLLLQSKRWAWQDSTQEHSGNIVTPGYSWAVSNDILLSRWGIKFALYLLRLAYTFEFLSVITGTHANALYDRVPWDSCRPVPGQQRHLKLGLSLHQRPTLLALCCHLLPTPIPSLPAPHLPPPVRLCVLPPLKPIRELHRRHHELGQW